MLEHGSCTLSALLLGNSCPLHSQTIYGRMLQYQQHMSRFPVESSEQTMSLTDMRLVLQVRLHRWRLGRMLDSDAHVSG